MAVCTLLAVGGICQAQETPVSRPLVLGLMGPQAAADVTRMWRPVQDKLEMAVARPVEILVGQDYASVIWALKAGKVDLAWLGPKTAIQAIDLAEAEVCARVLYPDGQNGYRSVLIVHRDAPWQSFDDLLAQAPTITFGDGDRNSTSGHLIPDHYLFSGRGLDPRTLFKRVVASNHESNFTSVVDRTIDAAAISTTALKRFTASHPEKAALARVIWTSPLIPPTVVVWHKDLAQTDKAKILGALEDFGKRRPDKPASESVREQKALARLGLAGFAASDDAVLAPIRAIETGSGQGSPADTSSATAGSRLALVPAPKDRVGSPDATSRRVR